MFVYAPLPQHLRIGLTFDMDLCSAGLNIDGVIYSAMIIYVRSFKGSVFLDTSICCTRCGRPTRPLTLTFDLPTWVSMGIIKDYLPTEFEPSRTNHYSVANCTRSRKPTWPYLLTWISIGIIYSSRTIYPPSLNLLRQRVLHQLYNVK